MKKESEIVNLVSRKLIPYIFIFGLYLISYGHISPGGGFQGGVVLGAGVILLCITRGVHRSEEKIPLGIVKSLEPFMLIVFIIFGLIGTARGVGDLLFLNLVIGVKVACAIAGIFYLMIKTREA